MQQHNVIATRPVNGHNENQMTKQEKLLYVCDFMGCSPELIRALSEFSPEDLRELCRHRKTLCECAPKLKKCIPALDNLSCDPAVGNLQNRLSRCEDFINDKCCPAQNLYGEVTIHEYSSKSTLFLKNIVQGLGGNFVNTFPVPSGNSVMITHDPRPGFVPELTELHFTLANSGTNYLNLEIHWFVGETKIGSEMLGSQFLDNDGRTKRVKFPPFRGKEGILVGSNEKVSIQIHVTGPNALEFATVALYLDAKGWANACLPPDGSCR